MKTLSLAVLLTVCCPSLVRAASLAPLCEAHDIVVLIDVSASIAADETRRGVADAVETFLDGVGPQHRIALVTFGAGAEVRLDLAPTDGDTRTRMLAAVERLRFDAPWTDIRAGVDAGYNLVASGATDRKKLVLLLTDGVVSVPGPSGVESAAAAEENRRGLLDDLVPQMRKAGVALWAIVYNSASEQYALLNAASERTSGLYRRELQGVGRIREHARAYAEALCRAAAEAPKTEPTTESTTPTQPEKPRSGTSNLTRHDWRVPTSEPSRLSNDARTERGDPLGHGEDGIPLAVALPALLALNFGIARLMRRVMKPSALDEDHDHDADAQEPDPIPVEPPPEHFTPRATSVLAIACALHPKHGATWVCIKCGRHACDSCPGRFRKPPTCDDCTPKVSPEPDEDSTATMLLADPRPLRPERAIFLAAFTREGRLIRKVDCRRDGSDLWLYGPTGLLAVDLANNAGAVRCELDGEEPRVAISGVPPGGFYDLDTGRAYDVGTPLKNNLRFAWKGDAAGRWFEVIFK